MFADMDVDLGINQTNHRMTNGFREMITYLGQASASFEDARDILKKLKGIDISASQMQIVTEEIGAGVFAADMEEAAAIFRSPERYMPHSLEKDKAEDILYILMDGSSVNTRVQDVGGNTWKEMKLGMVFRSKDVITRGTKIESCTITQKEYVTYFGEVGKFKELLFAAALRAGYGSVKNVVVIGDGAHWIWNLCEECFPDATQILDYYHMVKNVYDYVGALFPNDDKKKIRWANSVIWYIETDQYDKAMKMIKKDSLGSVLPETTVNLEGYLTNNKDRVRYLDFKGRCLYIGSGMIEGGNKVVIQKRMKQCGMRWSVQGGQFVAALRAKSQSQKWDVVEDQCYHNLKLVS